MHFLSAISECKIFYFSDPYCDQISGLPLGADVYTKTSGRSILTNSSLAVLPIEEDYCLLQIPNNQSTVHSIR